MKYNQLGSSDLTVSEICLGTMTWGQQNSESDAHEQLDFALSRGVNFIDTAEMYAVPPTEETYTLTEQYLGSWLKARKNRDKVIIATKVAGPSGMPWIRGGEGLTVNSIDKAIAGSLKRLNTDYIDLYQLHWPQRRINAFGRRDFAPEFARPENGEDHMLEVLSALKKHVDAGRIREVGLSNETPWGMMKYLQLHQQDANLPRVQSTQNPYSLIQREFDNHSSEVCFRENISLLPYSPLAGGILSGKYAYGKDKQENRFNNWGSLRQSGLAVVARSQVIKDYSELAKSHGLNPVHMALAFVNSRFFVGSSIIGATSLTQLGECLDSVAVQLSDEVLQGIEAIHAKTPNPGLY